MRSQRTFVAIGLILASILVFYVLSNGFEWLWNYMSWEDFRLIGRQVTLTTVLGFGIGFGAGAFCWFNKKINGLLNEVVEEVRKVVWPTRDETVAATIVVLIAIFIFGAYLGALDAIFTWLTGLLMSTKGVA